MTGARQKQVPLYVRDDRGGGGEMDTEMGDEEGMCHAPPRQGRGKPALGESGLGAEEDGFALEGFEGQEEGESGVDAGGGEDDGDGIPVISAGDDLLADQAGVENGNEGELGGEL